MVLIASPKEKNLPRIETKYTWTHPVGGVPLLVEIHQLNPPQSVSCVVTSSLVVTRGETDLPDLHVQCAALTGG